MIKERYSLNYLKGLKTLSQGQADDLKIDRDGYRVWLSRLTVEDGMPYNNQVTVEQYQNTEDGWMWVTISEYQAKSQIDSQQSRQYKFSELSSSAKEVAIKDYNDGWEETHPGKRFSREETIGLLKDTENEVFYDKNGNLIY